ncbi:MAG: hypothetical protein M3396_10560 [Actinomycetota bacterium]|nr:hypothetical protein [Actinomycetota bacterium]
MNRTFAAVSFSKGIEDAWTKVAAFVPKLFAFLVILVIGWFVAKAIAKLINGILERVGFDQAVERGGVKKALERSKYDASDVLGKIVYYAVLLLVLQMAFGVFGTNLVSALIAGVIAFLPKVFAAIIIVIVAAAIAAAAKEIVQTALGGLSYGKALAGVASAAIMATGLFAALSQLQIAPAIVNGLFYALLAIVAGSAVIAIGGGGIQPMRAQWEKTLAKVQDELPQARQEAQGASERIATRGQELKEKAQ